MAGGKVNGHPETVLEDLDRLEKFASYAFNKKSCGTSALG